MQITESSVEKLGNIGPKGQRQRRVMGTLSLGLAGALLVWLDWSGVSRWWRPALFPPLWLGLAGLIQAQQRTCVALAARGTCDADAGISAMTEETARLFRVRGRHITRWVTILAVLLTLAALAIP
jgi:hypothetical protein